MNFYWKNLESKKTKDMEELTKYILKGGFRLEESGISLDEAISFEKIIAQKIIKEHKRSNSGATLSEIRVLTTEGEKTWYAGEFGWGAGDDADAWVELHHNIDSAKKSFNNFVSC